jgi:hypothetical protein
MRRRLARDFGSAFPITGIDGLGEFSHFDESLWLPNSGNVVLDSTRKTFVVLMTKSRVVPLQLR